MTGRRFCKVSISDRQFIQTYMMVKDRMLLYKCHGMVAVYVALSYEA
jgi:hypothetical protein